MDWRREDSGYAAAVVAVVAFVGYLLAANFGLVPSPLAPILDGASSAVATIEAPQDLVASPVDMPLVAPPAQAVDRPSKPVPPTAADGADTARPAVNVETTDGAKLNVANPAVVRGVAGDLESGVDKVLVTFRTATGKQVVPADVTCKDAGRRACTWTAKVPGVLATYAVSAQVIDRAGNIGHSTPIDITVVNTADTLEQVGGTVGRLPTAVGKAVGGLLDALGLGG